MSIKDKLKNKVLDSSDSYNHYKDESYKLSNDLSKEIKDLKKEIKTLKKKQKQTDKVLNSYNKLFNRLYLDFELEPKGALKYTQELCLDLLDFIANICKKHDLTFWLDGGNALGAFRHGGFVPWDDDVDICILRKDLKTFKEVIDEEIKLNNLEGIVGYSVERRVNNKIFPFMNVTIMTPNAIYAAVDVFAMDFIVNPPEDIEDRFKQAKVKFHENLLNDKSREETLKEYYETLNLSHEKQDYMIPAVEGVWGNSLKFKLFETDRIFPLGEASFEDRTYPCANDLEYYISTIYGEDFRKIPKVVGFHQRLDELKKNDGYEEEFEKYLKIMKEANENFKL